MSARKSIVGRLVRGLLTAAGIVVILLAIAIGVLRIAATQLPSYQAQIEHALGEALGLELGFERMDVRFALRGPELTFHSATVAAPSEGEPFLSASRAAVVLDAWALVRREIRVKRLTLDGTTLTLLRLADGRLALERAPDGDGASNLDAWLPVEVEIAVRDSTVRYLDAAHGVDWTFTDLALDLGRSKGMLELDARARPPAEIASGIEVGAQADLRRGDAWRVFGRAERADLAEIGAALPDIRGWPVEGRGDVSIWLEWQGGTLVRGLLDAALADLEWAEARGARYDRAAFAAEWTRTDTGFRLALNDVEIVRDGRDWPDDADLLLDVATDDSGWSEVSLESSFLRIEDLAPIVVAFDAEKRASVWLDLEPRGDLIALDATWRRGADVPSYDVSARFDRLGLEPSGNRPGFDGLSGEVRADTASGRLELTTRSAQLDWPALFRSALDVEELSGLVVWREGADAIRVVGDELVLATPDVRTRSSFEITFPVDGGSPTLDLAARADGFPAVAASRYLPASKMPRRAVEWLDSAIRGGRVVGADLEFVGPLAAFPFDAGEGLFRVTATIENGILRYVSDWPVAQDLDGTIEFRNASFSARGNGRVLGNVAEEVRVEIPDLRRPVLELAAETHGPLDEVLTFLRSSPPIAAKLGPGYERLSAPEGTGDVAFELALPLLDMTAYRLDAALTIDSGALSIDGFAPRASDIRGTLRFADGSVAAQGIEAIFLDGPVTASVSPAGVDGYRTRVDVDGEVTAAAVIDAFDLPLKGLAAGQTRWSGSLLLPSVGLGEAESAPLRVEVRSNLSGLALNLPEPFAKQASEPTSLQLDFAVAPRRLDIEGNYGATRRFAISLEKRDDRLELARGALAFGGSLPEPPAAGLGIYGNVRRLDVDEWAALLKARSAARAGGGRRARGIDELLAEVRLDIGDLAAFGQEVGAAQLDVRRGDTAWLIDIDSAQVAGSVRVPRDLRGRPAIVADMERLYLTAARQGTPRGGDRRLDPRAWLGLDLTAADFRVGARKLGALSADVRATPLGLELVSFESRGPSFSMSGNGGWFEGPSGPTTELEFTLLATDVKSALEALSLEPIASGEMAEINASVRWPGAPNDRWMDHLDGEVKLRLEDGSLLDIDPGAGRVVGLMSITLLPRRLALDFRDVFNKGLVFDELGGGFTIIDGNAYTNDFKVSGPVAEIGMAGRIGLRDRDYSQHAVVTAEPGNMLPTVGGLIGGPGVGAALLIFTRIFKEPLKGIGRASYCITGSWDEPIVERLSAEEIEQGRLCAELPHEEAVRVGERR
ncbi:MAG: YhdP family protein [Gammaproteobacteria bacterium]